jgi:fluoride exporter
VSAWAYVGALIGCGLGAALRYLLGRIDHPWSFPWPTIVANAIGSAALGAASAAVSAGAAEPWVGLVVATGFAGGLTTFSSLAVDAVVLWRDGRRRDAAVYLAVTLVVGVAAAGLGWALAAP